MALRMVAGESPRMWWRAMEREPTGSARSTYSAITARRTWRRRSSRWVSAIMGPILHRREAAGWREGSSGEAPPEDRCEAYLLYVERPVEGGNEPDGPLSPPAYRK